MKMTMTQEYSENLIQHANRAIEEINKASSKKAATYKELRKIYFEIGVEFDTIKRCISEFEAASSFEE